MNAGKHDTTGDHTGDAAPAGCPKPVLGEGRMSTEELFPVLYGDLRQLAHKLMEREQKNHIFAPTALVNEAFVRLAESKNAGWQSRGHLYAAAAETLRRILIDQARSRDAKKRGGGRRRVDIDKVDAADKVEDFDWIALDESMDALLKENPERYTVVLLRFYAGLSVEETAEILEVSDRTVKREWASAREWLFSRLGGEGSPPAAGRSEQ